MADIVAPAPGEPSATGPTRALKEAVERFVAASPDGGHAAFRQLTRQLRLAQDDGRNDDLAEALRLALVPTLDFTSVRSLHRFYEALPPDKRGGTSIRLAILGGFTTHQLRDLVELFLFAGGIDVEIYESDYDVFRQEILDPTSALHAFRPDILYLATHWRNLGHRPPLSATTAEVDALLEDEFADWSLLWQVAHERLGCQIIQNGFDTPPWRALDNYEMRHPASLSRFIAEINRRLAERAPPHVTPHDVEALVARAGRTVWANERFYLLAKMPCAPEYLVDYAHSVASVVKAQLGFSKKCLVLDLDNTLWGGVIGDDGMGGIRIGQGDAEGESFAAFQRYAKTLASRGVILAVCSKNTDAIAREVFEQHPDMVLRLDDIACFVANWTDKASNLRQIAATLNIGVDSLVFVDDNPAERSIIRRLVPEVAVPEVGTDPIDFIEVLERQRYFQVASLGTEDFKRTDYYRANATRTVMASSSADMDQFLASLNMAAAIGPVTAATLERSTQLINKSNQFNLTTRRKTMAEVQAAMTSPDWTATTVTLTDRFGDNGLICVALAREEGDALAIDTWLMSCRVLKRGVERFLLNDLVEQARARGLAWVRGEYIPTAKNGLVRDHYADLGFQLVTADDDGRTTWRLSVAAFTPLANHITRTEPS